MLGGIHAADFGAIGLTPPVAAPAADALNEYDLLGRFAVGQPLQVPLGGTGGVHQPLQLQGGNHILALLIGIFAVLVQLDGIEPGGDHDRAVFPGDDLVLLGIVNGSRLAELFTDAALAGFQLDAGSGVDHRHVGNGLGKGGVDGAAGIQPSVEFIQRLLGGAFFLTHAAAGALVHVHVTRLLADVHRKAAHKAGYPLHLAVGVQGDILVGGGVHHFWGQNTGGAVQGGEGLVQLGHAPADGRLLFHNVHLEPGVGNVQRGLDTGDAAADDQRPLGHLTGTGQKRRVQMHLGNGSPHENDGLLGCLLHIFMNPGAVLPDVGDFHQIGVQPVLFRTLAEGGLMHPGRAGADHQAIQLLFPDGLGNAGLTRLGAHIGIVLGVYHARLPKRQLHHLFHIHRGGNIAAAVADKYTNSAHFLPPILSERTHQQLLRHILVQQGGNFLGGQPLLAALTDQ